MKKSIFKIMLPVLLLVVIQSCSKTDAIIYGKWTLNRDKSTDLASWRYRQLELEIASENNQLTIIQNWTHKRYGNFIDSVAFKPGIDTSKVIVKSPVWQKNWFMGILAKVNSVKTVCGSWQEIDKKLTTETKEIVAVSQGDAEITTVNEFSLNRKGDILTVTEKRSTRPTPITLVFDRTVQE